MKHPLDIRLSGLPEDIADFMKFIKPYYELFKESDNYDNSNSKTKRKYLEVMVKK